MTGEVAGLFPKEELDSIVGDMRPIMKLECPGEHWSIYYFVSRVVFELAHLRFYQVDKVSTEDTHSSLRIDSR